MEHGDDKHGDGKDGMGEHGKGLAKVTFVFE
jgi:hypothetical protein